MLRKFRLYIYDLYGNENDNNIYVNNTFRTNQFYLLDDDWSGEQVTRSLIDQNLFSENIDKELISIDGESEYVLYIDYGGYPECVMIVED